MVDRKLLPGRVNTGHPVFGSLDDLCSLENLESIARHPFHGEINLRDYNLPRFVPGDDYTSIDICVKGDEQPFDHYDEIKELCVKGKHTGKHEKFYAAVIEAFRNAHQHGNKRNQDKKIVLSYRLTDNNFEVVVSDEGGIVNADFIPFVLLHRQGLEQPYSFYRFSPAAIRGPDNSGLGTSTMHLSADAVNYYVNKSGGLSVRLFIRKSS